MNRFIKALVGTAIGLGIAATSFGATSFVTPTYITDANAPGVKYTLASAAASGDTISMIVKTSRFLNLERGGALATIPSILVVSELAASAAGDSLKVQIDAGSKFQQYGVNWVKIIDPANMNFHVGGNTTLASTSTPAKAAFIAASTLVPATYWRIRLITLSTLAAGQTYTLTFPRGNK